MSRGRRRLLILMVVAGAAAALVAVVDGGSSVRAETAGHVRRHDASGPTVYVDEASVGGPCSDARTAAQAALPATPLCTIGAGIAQVGPAGTVLVRGGAYPALSVSGGTRTGVVTVEANGSESVTLPSITIGSGTGLLRFSGLNLTGSSSADTFGILDGAHDIQLVNSVVATQTQEAVSLRPGVNNVAIAGNVITSEAPGASSGGDGVTFLSTSTLPGSPPNEPNDAPISNVTILNNHFSSIGSDAIRPTNFVNLSILGNDITGVNENGSHTDAIQTVFGGTNLDIEGNYIHDNHGEGILIKDGQVTNAKIVNNVFAHNSLEYQLQVTGTNGLLIANNTFWANELSVVMRPGVTNGVVENNIFDNLSGAPAYSISGITEDYDLVNGGYGWTFGPHDIHGSPRFVNAAGGDFRLADGSPGIDAADGAVAPAYDKACQPRYDAPSVANRGVGSPAYADMGALEYGPGSQPTDTASPFMQCSAPTTTPLPTSGLAPLPKTHPPAKLFCAGVVIRRARRSRRGLAVSLRSHSRGALKLSASLVRLRHHRRPLVSALGSARARVPAGRTVTVTVKLSRARRLRLAHAGRHPRLRVAIHAGSTKATACSQTVNLRAG